MDSILIMAEGILSIRAGLNWANELIGNPVPGYESFYAECIEQFQIIMDSEGYYTIVVLVSVRNT